jgi:hypothetical protein
MTISYFRIGGDDSPPSHGPRLELLPTSALGGGDPLQHSIQHAEQVSDGDDVAVLVHGRHRGTQIYHYLHLSGGVCMIRLAVRLRYPAKSSSLRVVGLMGKRVGLTVGDVAVARPYRVRWYSRD